MAETSSSEGPGGMVSGRFRWTIAALAAGVLTALALSAVSDVFSAVSYLPGTIVVGATACFSIGVTLALAVRSRMGVVIAISAMLCLAGVASLWWLRTEQVAGRSVLRDTFRGLKSPPPEAIAAPVDLVTIEVPAAIQERLERNRDLIEQLTVEFGLGFEPFMTQLQAIAARDDLQTFEEDFLLTSTAHDVVQLLGDVSAPAFDMKNYGELPRLVRAGEFASARSVIVEALKVPRISRSARAQLLAAQAGLEQLGFDYESAGRQYQQAAALTDEETPEWELAALRAFYRDGTMWAKLESLITASQIAAELNARSLVHVGAVVPYQLEIARSMRRLPSTQGDALMQANAVLLAAITTVSRLNAPNMLARLQLERGKILRQAGGSSLDTEKLRQAIEALQLAQSPAAGFKPQMAAVVENELGLAHRLLGQADRAEGASLSAVHHFRQALNILDGESDDPNAIVMRVNLGVALRFAGIARSDGALLNDAASTFEAVLAKIDRQSAPLDWAAAQTGLANTLLAIAESSNDIRTLERAVAAYKRALEGAQTDGRSSADWAKTQNALANALQSLGERTNLRSTLEEALVAREGAWVLYQYSGQDNYDFYFESRLATQRTYLETMPLN